MIDESITTLTGIGDKTKQQLNVLGIDTILDVCYYFPNRYDHYEQKALQELGQNEKVTISGTIIGQPNLTFYGKKKSRLLLHLQVEGITVKGIIFNRPYAKKHFEEGQTVTLSGKWDQHRLQITIDQYQQGTIQNNSPITPIYPLKGEVKNIQLVKLIQRVLDTYSIELEEFLPEEYLINYKLPPLREAIIEMHQPSSFQALKHAKRRFIYEEFLLFQLKMQFFRKRNREALSGNEVVYEEEKVKAFERQLPFILTDAQKKSLAEILADMRSPFRMNRLLQGDVGSGKTVVAAISLYAAITANKQVAFMVPTEILAEQHLHSLKEWFKDNIKIRLLTGSVKGKKRKELYESIQNGEVDVVIGTHALIQGDVHFKNLGFVIIDEQHRFGVNQRNVLRDKGILADVLFMTATPIPRTLSITAYGDMDVSKINQMPSGRKTIETYWVKHNMFARVVDFIKKEVASGHQAYVICPLIEESENLDYQNAIDLFTELTQLLAPNIQVGLMHGRLPSEEKDEVMEHFSSNKIQVLVSTTVIEVGVNVPNATLMIINDAERFGLSQLHQLRGRVGRGDIQSYCILLADPKGEVGKERMRIMTETNDGFLLSEKDLELRGPGDLFGNKQSGLPDFKVGDIIHDHRALETARQDAIDIVYQNKWKTEAYIPLVNKITSDTKILKDLLN
ncbi:ATP-dependent DNA helicase RecG [Saliterribacillus persicus]|uniref:ATP-dependent DNA helicase RecG n=1 Tax=Saliterribacillus persicus TaxID=930114 RepID=UPI000DF3C9B2|nr:ATP-dependent DNA helicase RecG [Saliterribacillus persicus]